MSEFSDFCLTAGELKRLLKNVPEDAIIYYERIEDIYFQERGWKNTSVYVSEKVHGFNINGEIEEEYSCEFTPAFTVFTQEDHPKKVFITAHY